MRTIKATNEQGKLIRFNNETTLILCTRPLIGSPSKYVLFLKIRLKMSQISKPILGMVVLECICHGDSKHSHQVPDFLYFSPFCETFNLSSAHVCRVESIKIKWIIRYLKPWNALIN